MNMLEYCRIWFPTHDLTKPSGANDGTNEADVLAEMPVDSNCGDACVLVLTQARTLCLTIDATFAGDEKAKKHITNILDAAVDTCLCYIRG